MSSSHGQRFRRRAVRRGYKVDEVDQFLDRVEATLNGTPLGVPVGAQDVHEVVFRVRFGGYDEWQVDLHLDRVERQIAELEERAAPSVGAQLRATMAPPPMMDRSGAPPPPLPTRVPNAHAPTSTIPRYEQFDPPPRREEPAFPRRDEGAFAGSGSFAGLNDHPSGSFPGFGPPPDRNPRPDITGEIRPARSDPYGSGGYGAVNPDPYSPPARGGYDSGATGAFSAVPSSFGPPAPSGGAESQRVDQLRRTFQLRRFGSGYDPGQVDRLFDNVLGALSGRGGVNEAELDPSRLNLVPGGYYEAEVDQAIREVREILRAR
ncbi:MAG TPA: DivIVA domain-containing protein [Candidatus Limnocylindrales bacterium]|nr:DivIVA domain-containing protein [Candidatus Limnocylindrales bacterium]